MSRMRKQDFTEGEDARLEEATEWFLRVRAEDARVDDLPEFKRWLEAHPGNEVAYRKVAATWQTVGTHASAPEIMIGRRDALDDTRRAARRRWSVRGRVLRNFAFAASVLLVILGVLVWLQAQRGVYTTELGERRMLTLEDGSVVTLDARSRIRVSYKPGERFIALERGQARFDVARDPTRPFRVRAGDQTIIALGTQFDVEIVAGDVLVTMIEGQVAVAGVEAVVPSIAEEQATRFSAKRQEGISPASVVELKAGERLRVRSDGQAILLAQVEIDRVTAWQSGKLFFDDEPLAAAAERMNRYSALRIEVDPRVANLGVSGAFNAGDSAAFIEAITSYFPVQAHYEGASEVQLSARD